MLSPASMDEARAAKVDQEARVALLVALAAAEGAAREDIVQTLRELSGDVPFAVVRRAMQRALLEVAGEPGRMDRHGAPLGPRDR